MFVKIVEATSSAFANADDACMCFAASPSSSSCVLLTPVLSFSQVRGAQNLGVGIARRCSFELLPGGISADVDGARRGFGHEPSRGVCVGRTVVRRRVRI